MNLIVNKNRALWNGQSLDFSLGRAGIVVDKIEGDGGTPVGLFPFRRVFYRPDRIQIPHTSLPVQAITPQCGWCDDPASPQYNQHITKPFAPSHETMWMEKHLYDVVLVVGHNDNPVVPEKGSAVFVHVAPQDFGPTAGCVGLKRQDLLQIIEQADLTSNLIVKAN